MRAYIRSYFRGYIRVILGVILGVISGVILAVILGFRALIPKRLSHAYYSPQYLVPVTLQATLAFHVFLRYRQSPLTSHPTPQTQILNPTS